MAGGKPHQLTLSNREEIKLTGIIRVNNFDEEEIDLETNMGVLAVRGEGLHINQLNIDTGEVAVIGLIKSLQYLEEQGMKNVKRKGKGFLDRILK